MPATTKSAATRALHVAGALAIVGVITFVDSNISHANHTTISLTFLMGVLGIAAKWGLVEAIIASIASILSSAYFFYPPLRDFAIEDPQNWLAVTAFFIVSVVASQLSASARKRAREAIQRGAELETLYTLSRGMMMTDVKQDAAQGILDVIRSTLGARAAILYYNAAGIFYRSGIFEFPPPEALLQQVAQQPSGSPAPLIQPDGLVVLPVELGGTPSGSIGLHGVSISDTALQSVASLAAIALDHSRNLQAASDAEAARQSQELKSLLLDAVAHQFKTPLTSIKFGATVLSNGTLSPAQHELVTVIEEETDRLNIMITEAIQVARIEAGDVQLNRSSHPIGPMLHGAVERLRPMVLDRPFQLSVAEGLPEVTADPDLVTMTVIHLLDNAIKYSPQDAPIAVSARLQNDSILISVSDRGPGIPAEDRQRIFERFFRGRPGAHIQGTGMGLSIANEIVKLHGGRIWAENRHGGGASVCFTLPLASNKSAA